MARIETVLLSFCCFVVRYVSYKGVASKALMNLTQIVKKASRRRVPKRLASYLTDLNFPESLCNDHLTQLMSSYILIGSIL